VPPTEKLAPLRYSLFDLFEEADVQLVAKLHEVYQGRLIMKFNRVVASLTIWRHQLVPRRVFFIFP